MPTLDSARPRAHAISVADGRNETIRGIAFQTLTISATKGTKAQMMFDHICAFVPFVAKDFVYGSPSPFLPFFFAGGSASRGRVEAGGGASTFGVVVSVFGCGFAGPSSLFGGGGKVTCSSFGSVVVAGNAFSSSFSSALAISSARSAAN